MPYKIKTIPFSFHRIGWINADGKIISGWWALVETKEQLDSVYKWKCEEIVNIWLDVKNSPEDKEGHCKTRKADVAKMILNMEMEKQGVSRLPMIDCINLLENRFVSTMVNIFNQYGKVYINSKGGCRTVDLCKNYKEQIFEEIVQPDFVFPDQDAHEFSVDRFADGRHWYIKMDGRSIEIAGKLKYNTVTAAEEAMEDFIKRNKFGGK